MKQYCASCRNTKKAIAGKVLSTVVKIVVLAIVVFSAYQQFLK